MVSVTERGSPLFGWICSRTVPSPIPVAPSAIVTHETGLTAVVTTLHAIGSVPAGSASWFWWIFAITNIVLVATLVSGIGRAGTEKPIV